MHSRRTQFPLREGGGCVDREEEERERERGRRRYFVWRL